MRALIFLLLSLFTLPIAAQQITPEQHALIYKLEGRLMAPCCYSQTIREHMSQEAAQMRQEVTAMVIAGKSEQEIVDYYKTEYGDTILVVPDGNSGIVLFTTPFALLILSGLTLILLLRVAIKRNHQIPKALPVENFNPEWVTLRNRIRSEIGDTF
jgi:cytochrome c-type biogenesis protein CcmH